jgi:hypothetical protein
MSSVIVLTPIIIAGWPAITAAITAAVGAMGFSAASAVTAGVREGLRASGDAAASTMARAEIDVADSEILAATQGTEQSIVVERDGIRATFSRDARGALKVCMEGRGYSKAQLKQIGEELIERVTQQYAYHRIVTELKERNMTIVDEEVDADRTVRIRVRNF